MTNEELLAKRSKLLEILLTEEIKDCLVKIRLCDEILERKGHSDKENLQTRIHFSKERYKRFYKLSKDAEFDINEITKNYQDIINKYELEQSR